MAKNGKKQKRPSPVTPGHRLLRWIFRPRFLIVAAVVAVGVVCWPLVQQRMPRLKESSEYLVDADNVEVSPPPRWVPANFVEQVFQQAELEEPLSLLDRDLTEQIALAFYAHPWVEKLKQVRKSFPARVYVEVVYRKPVAMVQLSQGGYLPVDRYGVLLPIKDFSSRDLMRYPVIRGIQTLPTGYEGESWGDPAVTGAAQLAALLLEPAGNSQTWWQRLELAAILAPRHMAVDDNLDNLQYQLVSSGGSVILWGRTPSSRHPGELDTEKKLQRLADYHQKYQGFDSGPLPVKIDIRDWHGTKRSLLAADEIEALRR